MKKTRVVITAGLVFASAALQAQTEKHSSSSFQYFIDGPGPAVAGIKMLGIEGMTGQLVIGKPLSATEERETLQTLGDGTRITNSQTNKFYRDSDGRTRVERPNGAVVIHDPVAGFVAEINPENKTVHRMVFKTNSDKHTPAGGGAGPELTVMKEKLDAEMAVRSDVLAVTVNSVSVVSGKNQSEAMMKAAVKENLGLQSVNGVTAQGDRTTMTIPVGQIGNNRPIQVVSEQWFSTDLQMLVKSTNSDPRFGETSYQLTNINQAAPDPSLVASPADYTAR